MVARKCIPKMDVTLVIKQKNRRHCDFASFCLFYFQSPAPRRQSFVLTSQRTVTKPRQDDPAYCRVAAPARHPADRAAAAASDRARRVQVQVTSMHDVVVLRI